ncbi:tape measure protein [Parapusillimonas sp. JC17]|uniref:tape measure protein n=1 Tax=Parapusillimonas sp. JC17 TaxID=3445768 RepID=UPI003F9EFEA6
MTQESRLAIVIDSRQAQPSAEDLAKALDALDAAGVRVTSSSARAGRSAADAGRAYTQTGRDAKFGADGVDRVNRSLDQTESSAAAAAASIRRNLIAAVGGLSAMKLIDVADDWGQMASRIKMATESAAEYERVQARMVQSANATYRNINETREAFVQLSPVLRQMGMSLDQSMDAIDAFSGLMVTNAASTERGAAAMRALSVALQKGKLDADGWITIYSSLDSIVDTIAAHSGRAAEEIRKLGAEGKLSVELIAQALAGQLGPIMQQVEEMPTTVRDSMQKVANEFTNYIGKANEVNGVTATMADGIAYLGENLGGVLNVGLVAGSGALALYTSRTIGATTATVADVLAKRAAAMQELELAAAQVTQTSITLAQTKAQQGLSASRAQLATATAAHTAAEQRLAVAQAAAGGAGRSLLGVLGGPVGLLATVGLTAAAFVAMDGASARARISLGDLTGTATDASAAFAKLGTLSRQAALDTLGKLHSDQAREAGKAWSDFVADLEPTTAKGARAVAQMRSQMRAEVQGITSDTTLSSGEIEHAVDRLIDKWVEEGRVTAEQAQQYRNLAAGASTLQATANETAARIGELTQKNNELNASANAAAGGVSTLNNALAGTDEAGKKYLERLSDQSVVAGLKTQRQQLDAMVAAGKLLFSPEDLAKAQAHADKIDKATASLKSGAQATKDYASAMKSLLETHLPQNKALDELHKNLDLLGKAHKAGKVSAADYTKALLSINTAYAKQVTDLLPESVKKAQEQVKSAQEQLKTLTQQVRVYGLAESAATRLAVADTDSALAKLEAAKASAVASNASTERVREIEAEIHALKQLKDLQVGIAGQQQQLEFREAQKAQWEAWSRDVEQIFDRVGQSLTDAIFDGGKSGKDLLRDMFKSLTFNILINPVMKSLQGFVTNEIGALFGYQNPQQQSGVGGMLQNASSLNSLFGAGYQALTGASAGASTASLGYANLVGAMGGDSIGALISANGGWEGALSGLSSAAGTAFASGITAVAPSVMASLGSGAAGALASGMATTSFSAAMTGGALIPGLGVGAAGGGVGAGIGAAGAAGAAGGAAAGAGGLMAGLSAAAPYIGIGLAAASAFGLFDSGPPKTRHGQRTTIDYTGGAYGISAVDDRQAAGSEQAALAAAQSAVAAANDLFAKVGVNAGIESFYAIMESSVLGDRNGVASGGMLRIGDQLRQIGVAQASDMTFGGFGGWSSAEMLPRLQTDIQLSILEAFQAVSGQLPSVLSGMLEGVDLRNIDAATAQDLATRFSAVADGATQFLTAIEALPFEQLRGLSFDAAAGLVQLAGGVEGLLSAQQTYYQAFYSEAERHGIAVNNLTSALAAAGVVIPELTGSTEQMLASYRAIVEAQDLNTEAGRQAYVTLMGAAGAFAEVAQYAGQVAQAVEEVAVPARSLADIERERAGLESQLLGLLGNTNALRQRELETLDASNRALQQQIWSYQDLSTAYNEVVAAGEREIARLKESFGATDAAMSAYRSAVQRLESEFGSLIATIGRGVADLRSQVTEAARMQYNQARAVISTALITRQLPQTADLTETLRIAQQGVTGQVYGSLFEQQKAYLILANEMEALQGIAQPELDTARATLTQLENQYRLLRGMGLVGEDSLTALEQQLRAAISTEEAARRQISAIEEQINWAKEQYNVLLEIRDGVLTFPEALASFAQTLAAAVAAANKAAAPVSGGGGSAGGYTPVPGAGIGSSSWTTDYFLANPDVLQGYDVAHGMSPEAWAQYHWNTYGQYEGRKFAAGGFALPGWAMVGEEGPELVNFSQPGRVYTAGQTDDILRGLGTGNGWGNAGVITELRALREQNARLERRLASIERSTGQFASQFDNVTAGGNAMLTEDAATL